MAITAVDQTVNITLVFFKHYSILSPHCSQTMSLRLVLNLTGSYSRKKVVNAIAPDIFLSPGWDLNPGLTVFLAVGNNNVGMANAILPYTLYPWKEGINVIVPDIFLRSASGYATLIRPLKHNVVGQNQFISAPTLCK